MIARLLIQTAARANSTYLKNTYFTTPFKIANISEDRKTNPLHLMLMSSSPGILDGDQYQLKIELEEGSAVRLHTQGYQRLFNMQESASQSLEINLKPGSSFYFLPHPTVPHASSVFNCTSKIYLSTNCSLLMGEILTCGRKLNGEIFLFKKYHSVTEVFIMGKLVIKENLLIKPACTNLGAIGQLEGFTHQASLIYLHPAAEIKALIGLVISFLSTQQGIIFGVTPAPANGFIVRILGNKAEQLHDCLKSVAALLPACLQSKPSLYAV